jgi:hypothetical protein
MPPGGEHWTQSRPADPPLTGNKSMSFDRLKRPFDRLLGHKLKPSALLPFIQNSKPHLSMKISYFLGIDAAKHKTGSLSVISLSASSLRKICR